MRSNPRVESDAIARVAHARLTRTRYTATKPVRFVRRGSR